jgi:hypothetical protein
MKFPFVLSDNLKFVRYAIFWAAMIFCQMMVDFIVPTFLEGAKNKVFKESAQQVIMNLPGQVILVYALVYFIIPKYLLKSRYLTGIFLLILLFGLAGLVNEFLKNFFTRDGSFMLFSFEGKQSLEMHRMLGVTGFAACIQFIGLWNEKNYRYSILEKEKFQADSHNLMTQVHPHFLFNTINNIYSITQNTSREASDMLLHLSGLLRYILYECNRPEIKLSQEFKVINDYILLESIRYDKNLDVNIKLPDNTDKYLIAPLLLLPIIENCFKHGTSKMLDKPWISIQAELKEKTLNIKLINSKVDQGFQGILHEGIGLSNVRKRLELLYPGRYNMEILSEADVFVVSLKLELQIDS